MGSGPVSHSRPFAWWTVIGADVTVGCEQAGPDVDEVCGLSAFAVRELGAEVDKDLRSSCHTARAKLDRTLRYAYVRKSRKR